MQMFSGFVPKLGSDFKASRNKSEMRDIPFELPIVLKSRGYLTFGCLQATLLFNR